MCFLPGSGAGIGYQQSGTGDPIVLLHPVGMDRRFWEPLIRELPEGYACVSVDLPGHGESDVPAWPPQLADMASTMVVALDHILAGRPGIVVGCSMGGMVAQEIALARPDLVLTNTAHTLVDAGREAMWQRAMLALKGMDCVAELTLDRWFGPGFRQQNPQAIDEFRHHLLQIDPVVHA